MRPTTLHEYRLAFPRTALVPTLTQSGLVGFLLEAGRQKRLRAARRRAFFKRQAAIFFGWMDYLFKTLSRPFRGKSALPPLVSVNASASLVRPLRAALQKTQNAKAKPGNPMKKAKLLAAVVAAFVILVNRAAIGGPSPHDPPRIQFGPTPSPHVVPTKTVALGGATETDLPTCPKCPPSRRAEKTASATTKTKALR